MNGNKLPLFFWIVALAACTTSPSDSPDGVAEQFWAAAQAGDESAATALILPDGNANFNFDNKDDNVQDVRLGEVRTKDGIARVKTDVTALNDGAPMDIQFDTVLAKHEGEWRVDLDKTTGEMIQSILGVSMEALGQAMAEGMEEAMTEMGEAMVEGMQQMGEAMADGMQEMVDEAESNQGK